MYIVYVGCEKHSAWRSGDEANNQCRVLRNNGYKDVQFIYESVEFPNGHYFV